MELTTLTTSELAQRFRELAVARGRSRSSEVANSYFDESIEVFRELRKRGHDALAALLPLVGDDEDEVALHASSLLLEAYPVESMDALKKLSAVPGVLGFTAKMTIQEWEAGHMRLPD